MGEIFRPVRWPIAHQVLNKLVKIAPVEIHEEVCGQVFEYFTISYLFSWRTVTKVLFRKKGILGLAAVNESSRSELHLSRGRTGLGRGGPGAPPLPPAGPSTAGGPG